MLDHPEFFMTEREMVIANMYDPLDIWINSFGGCRSNYIKSLLESKYKVYNGFYDYKGCHYYKPVEGIRPEVAIFCYVENINLAITSQINRNMQHNFLKELPEKLEFSLGNWQNIIHKHVINWCTVKTSYPILYINTDKLEENKDYFDDMFEVSIENYNPNRTTKKPHLDLKPMVEAELYLKRLPDFGFKR